MIRSDLGIIIAGRYDSPDRWVRTIKDYEPMDDGKAYVTDNDNSNHILDLYDVIRFDPADSIETLAGSYFKVPNSCLHYVQRRENNYV